MNKENIPYIHRDISWLSFNYRVLQEAKDTSVPLYERIKFLAIYSSNLDEFFRVRVAGLRTLMRLDKKALKHFNVSPNELLLRIRQIVDEQQEEFSKIFEQSILPELKIHGVNLLQPSDLNEDQLKFAQDYFTKHLTPFVQPILLVKQKIRPFLTNGSIYLIVNLLTKGENDRYALVKVPSNDVSRFVKFPSDTGYNVMILDDIVRASLPLLFPGYEVKMAYSIKLTRDAEIDIDDEFTGDLIEKIKSGLSKRNSGPTTRFVYDRSLPKRVLRILEETFSIEESDLLREGRYHNNSDLFGFPDFNLSLRDEPLPPIEYSRFENGPIYKKLIEKDHLLQFPYHKYEYVLRLFEEAADDPDVTEIKLIQYRAAKRSRIMVALRRAVKNGKKVVVFMEVKARFDEEANLQWAERLEKWGVTVLYSFPGLKVHSKLAVFTKKTTSGVKHYAYLSTGNFNEDTAKIYTDFGLFTSDKRITKEIEKVFKYLGEEKTPDEKFKHLLVGQFNLRRTVYDYIDREIEHAKAGKKAFIYLKFNSLEERKIIRKLYEASNAGVQIKIIVRGICCLVPGVKGYSTNIKARSIVDRFLEHSRVYMFHNDGENDIYLSSADWMTRNLRHRVECAFPVYDNNLKSSILETFNIQWQDNVKARHLGGKRENVYVEGDKHVKNRSQKTLYNYYKSLDEKEN